MYIVFDFFNFIKIQSYFWPPNFVIFALFWCQNNRYDLHILILKGHLDMKSGKQPLYSMSGIVGDENILGKNTYF